ncbi:MAG TPA: response regulator [Gemmataceae bacterium]|nr:response regulator [Gemmataceae bacterium]
MTTELVAEEGRVRVLVVDDNTDAADSLCALLRVWGYDARAAYDGNAGLEAASALLPDCLFLDIGLPGLDGYALAERLRRHPVLKRAKLVALSAYSDTERSRAAGFDAHFVKPADPEELEALLKMWSEVLKVAKETQKIAEQSAEVAKDTKQIIGEARAEMRELKGEVRELKGELRDLKGELREVKQAVSHDGAEDAPGA